MVLLNSQIRKIRFTDKMRVLITIMRVIGVILIIPIILAFPGFFLFQIAEELEDKQDFKEGKWR